MRASGYSLSSSITFLMIINAGGTVGTLLAGSAADRFGPVRVSAIWFILTACGTFLLRAHLPLGVACTVVFITGIRLLSAQAMVHSATSTVYAPAQRATGPGRVTGIGRTGAVVGPWPGGAVIEGGNGLGFTTFAAAVLGAAAIFLVPPARRARRGPAAQQTSAPAGATD
ncbi:hypothetical protein [Streptomyces sp. P5_D11]